MKQHVLLIDDDVSFGESLARSFLVYTRYSMKHEAKGTRWREAMSEYKPDFVLIDIDMAPMGGVSVANAIKADTEFASTKIMLITGHRLISENDKEKGQYQGYDCVSKEKLDVEGLARLIAKKLMS